MYNHSEKVQVRYSLQQLAGGLFYHLKCRPFTDIPVTDICRKAKVSRRTFYRNCERKEDLILYCTDVLVSELLGQVDFRERDPRKLYTDFFQYWEMHRSFLEQIYRNRLFDLFLTEFVTVCNSSMRYPLQEDSLKTSADRELHRRYSNIFIIGGLGLMLREWAAEGFAHSAGELAESILFLAPSDAFRDNQRCVS